MASLLKRIRNLKIGNNANNDRRTTTPFDPDAMEIDVPQRGTEDLTRSKVAAMAVTATELPYIYDPALTTYVPGVLDHSKLPILEPPSNATPMATKALSKALKETLKVQKSTPLHQLGFYVDGQKVGNLYQWIVELHSFEEHIPLATDMAALRIPSLIMEMRFPASYPASPPFIRLISPRILSFSQGGGGHVTNEGSVCLEMLTSTGWNPELSIEGILMQVHVALSNVDPRPARIADTNFTYNANAAINGYLRATRMHGWRAASDFAEFRNVKLVSDKVKKAGKSKWGNGDAEDEEGDIMME